MWAAVRLIYFVRSRGQDLEDFNKLAEVGLEQMFNGLLGPVFGPPEQRPTARDLIEYGLRRQSHVPPAADNSARLITDRERFMKARQRR